MGLSICGLYLKFGLVGDEHGAPSTGVRGLFERRVVKGGAAQRNKAEDIEVRGEGTASGRRRRRGTLVLGAWWASGWEARWWTVVGDDAAGWGFGEGEEEAAAAPVEEEEHGCGLGGVGWVGWVWKSLLRSGEVDD